MKRLRAASSTLPTRASRRPTRALALAVLAGAAALALGCGGRAAVGRAGTPNVLLLVSDDQGLAYGAYGWSDVATPNLDRFAAEGLRFDRAYTPSAVCAPSRAALYTGLVPVHNGCVGFGPIRDDVPIWSDRLGPAGFRTGLVGKVGGQPRARFRFDSFDRTLPEDDGARDVAWHVHAVESFLDGDDGRPFCLIVNFRDAHYPFPLDGAPSHWKGASETPHDPSAVVVPPFLVDLPEVRSELAHYYDSLRRLDVTVGAVLELLAARGLDDETLVLYTSDHGPPFPFAKTTLYEAGIRVPLVARWPGVIQPGRTTDALVSFVDVLPSLLDLAGVAVPGELDGRSLLPLLRGEPWQAREAFFGSHTDHRETPSVPARSVRLGDWKYIRNFRTENRFENLVMKTSASWRAMVAAAAADEALAARLQRLSYRPREELYDLSRDPHELADLAGDPALAERLAQLRALLSEHMRAEGDPLLAEWDS